MADVNGHPESTGPITFDPAKQCRALPPKGWIQQFCLVERGHVDAHQNYGGHIWEDVVTESRFTPTEAKAVELVAAANQRAERLAQRIVAARRALSSGQSALVVIAILDGGEEPYPRPKRTPGYGPIR